jgi:hypothetical protein
VLHLFVQRTDLDKCLLFYPCFVSSEDYRFYLIKCGSLSQWVEAGLMQGGRDDILVHKCLDSSTVSMARFACLFGTYAGAVFRLIHGAVEGWIPELSDDGVVVGRHTVGAVNGGRAHICVAYDAL